MNVYLTVRTQNLWPSWPFSWIFWRHRSVWQPDQWMSFCFLLFVSCSLESMGRVSERGILNVDIRLALVASTESWISWIITLTFHECWEWVLGHVVKHPKWFLTPLSPSSILSSPTYQSHRTPSVYPEHFTVVLHPDLSIFHITKWSLPPPSVPTHVFSYHVKINRNINIRVSVTKKVLIS